MLRASLPCPRPWQQLLRSRTVPAAECPSRPADSDRGVQLPVSVEHSLPPFAARQSQPAGPPWAQDGGASRSRRASGATGAAGLLARDRYPRAAWRASPGPRAVRLDQRQRVASPRGAAQPTAGTRAASSPARSPAAACRPSRSGTWAVTPTSSPPPTSGAPRRPRGGGRPAACSCRRPARSCRTGHVAAAAASRQPGSGSAHLPQE